MHHCVADFDARWKTVKDYAAYFLFEYAHQFRVLFQIFLRAKDRGREVTVEFVRCAKHLFSTVAVNEERCRAKHFF